MLGMDPLAHQLLIATVLVSATVMVHLIGLDVLQITLRWHIERLTRWIYLDRMIVPLGIVLGLFVVHGAEIWLYAVVYWKAGVIVGLIRRSMSRSAPIRPWGKAGPVCPGLADRGRAGGDQRHAADRLVDGLPVPDPCATSCGRTRTPLWLPRGAIARPAATPAERALGRRSGLRHALAAAQAVGQGRAIGYELQRHGIDAVAQPGRRRAVGKTCPGGCRSGRRSSRCAPSRRRHRAPPSHAPRPPEPRRRASPCRSRTWSCARRAAGHRGGSSRRRQELVPSLVRD